MALKQLSSYGQEKKRSIPLLFLLQRLVKIREHVERGYSVGAIDYIFKPFHPETLNKKLKSLLEIHQKHEEEISKSEWQRSVELKEVNQKARSDHLGFAPNRSINQSDW